MRGTYSISRAKQCWDTLHPGNIVVGNELSPGIFRANDGISCCFERQFLRRKRTAIPLVRFAVLQRKSSFEALSPVIPVADSLQSNLANGNSAQTTNYDNGLWGRICSQNGAEGVTCSLRRGQRAKILFAESFR